MPKNAEKPAIETAAEDTSGLASREAVFNAGLHQRVVQDLGAARLALLEAGVHFELVQQDLARKTAECHATAEQLAAAREEIAVLKGL